MDSLSISAFLEGSPLLFGDVTAILDNSPSLPIDHFPPSFGNDHPVPPSRDLEYFNCVEITSEYDIPFDVRPEDLFGSMYQTTYAELYHEYDAFAAAEAIGVQRIPQPTPVQYNISAVATLSSTNLTLTPVGPLATPTYPQFFGCAPQVPSSPFSGSDASIPTSPSVSSRSSDRSESDGAAECLPLSDDEYRSAQATSSESEGSVASSRSGRRLHPYKRHVSPRNFQCEDDALFVGGRFSSRCPVVGCNYIQKNRRVPDLKRHIETHGRWREPEKWVCCGVGMDRAHLHDNRFKPDMTDGERIEAGAYDFKGRLMVGGCMKTFSRRDALKRHIDNHKIPCIGHLNSYYF